MRATKKAEKIARELQEKKIEKMMKRGEGSEEKNIRS